jgi:hypothetical protein
MKRRVRIIWTYWLVFGGFVFPGLGYPEMRALLDAERHQAAKPARMSLPPRHGPERLATPELSPVERELWRCIQGEHGADCVGSR